MYKQIIKNTLIVSAFFVILTMTACSWILDFDEPICSEFKGCFQKNTEPRGYIDITQASCQLTGMGRGLFDVGNDSNAILLIHGNANIADEAEGSIPKKMITTNGNAAVNSVSKFGAGSVFFFEGSRDYLSIPNHADFNFSDGTWAIDMWVRVIALERAYMLYYQRTDASNYMYITIRNDNAVQFTIASNGNVVVNLTTPILITSIDSWYHIEVAENGNNYYIFIDGVQQASTSTASRPADYSGAVYIGADSSGGQSLNGYLDEIRVSKIVRHTARFTPPTEEYSGWMDVGWSFTGKDVDNQQTPATEATFTLNITMEGAGGEMFQVNASRSITEGSRTGGPLTLQRNGTSYVLSTRCSR